MDEAAHGFDVDSAAMAQAVTAGATFLAALSPALTRGW
jgi:hypothetical protein